MGLCNSTLQVDKYTFKNAEDDIARLCKEANANRRCLFTDIFGNGPKCNNLCTCEPFWSEVNEIFNRVSEADKARLKILLSEYLTFQKPL